MIAEQKLRTQRVLGGLIKQGQQNGELKTRATAKSSTIAELDSIGISKKQSSTFQQIASIPDNNFEGFINKKKQAVNNAVAELTTAGAIKLAKSLKQKKQDLNVIQDINSRLDVERELRALAQDLRKKYSKNEIELLIKFLTK